MTEVSTAGYQPPPYPYDRLDGLKVDAERLPGGCVDLSIGTPTDPPPDLVVTALSTSGAERGYPPSIGTPAYREAAAGWLERRFGVSADPSTLAACIGTKELVASTPRYLQLRRPDRDTVLYPEISYPTYEMGAVLAGCRAVPVPVDDNWSIDLSRIDPANAARALCLWVNSPGNPAGGLDELEAAASWGRGHDVPVLSDECYAEYTWAPGGRVGTPHTILEHGVDGVLAVHSLSKRSNLAGGRAGFYAGDPELVHYLSEIRKHAGNMVPGPVQAAGAAAWADDVHVDVQRERYLARLVRGQEIFRGIGVDCELPRGGFYLWVRAPDDDAWVFTARLAREGGMLVSPGEFYGSAGASRVRVAMVQPLEQLDLVAERLGVS